jgi:hypothetical protein
VATTNFIGTTDAVAWVIKTNNTERARVLSTGNVGIGTTTPAYLLDVAGQGNFTGSGGSSAGVIVTTATNPGMAWNMSGNAADEKWWDVIAASGRFMGRAVNDANSGATNWLQVNRGTGTAISSVTFPNGNVGIGMTNPGVTLDVTGTNAGTTSLQLRSGNTSASSSSNQILFAYNGTTNYRHAVKSRHNSAAGFGNAIDFYVFNPAFDAAGSVASRRVMAIEGTGAGRVGIGTGSPDTTLHVLGSIKMVDGNQATGKIMVSDANGVGIWTTASSALGNTAWSTTGNAGTSASTNFIGTTDAVDWVIKTNNTEQGRVTSAGKFGLGTTTPSEKLDVWGNIDISAVSPYLYFTSTGTPRNSYIRSTFSPTTLSGQWMLFQLSDNTSTGTTEVMRLQGDGKMGVNVASPVAAVDMNVTSNDSVVLMLRNGNTSAVTTRTQLSFSYGGGSQYQHVVKTRHQSAGDQGNAIDFFVWDQGTDAAGTVGTKRVMTIDGNGRGMVGIGTSVPDTNLHVVGAIKMVDGNQGSGKVMVSDANGVGSWQSASTALGGTAWTTTGNGGTTAGTNFVGTTDNQAFDIRTNNVIRTRITTKGQIEVFNTGGSVFVGESAGANDDLSNNQNAFVGYQSGMANTTGSSNAAMGYQSLKANTTGANNTAIGFQALAANTTGLSNTGVGFWSLSANTTGNYNTGLGVDALQFNTTGSYNIGVGEGALGSNTTGNQNVASGFHAMQTNTTGGSNTAIGHEALLANTTGGWNTATGYQALKANTTGFDNAGFGNSALISNTTGVNNAAMGAHALHSNTTGNSNTATGKDAMYSNTTASNNTAIGFQSMYNTTTGGNNTALGFQTLQSNTTGGNNIAIGHVTLQGNTTGSYNTGIGIAVLQSNTTGIGNIGSGYLSLLNNTTGSHNVALGTQSMYSNSTGGENVAFGFNALQTNASGSHNVAIGSAALGADISGSQNIAIGYNAGSAALGSGNIFLGVGSGSSETGSNSLYIDNSGTTTPLIYGNFATNSVTINDSLISKYFKMTNGATNGYILQSDATGNGKWVDGSTLSASTAWSLTGNSGTTPGTNFIGTTDAVDWVIKTSNVERVRVQSNGSVGIGTASPVSLLANTATNILSSDNHGVVNNSFTWAVNDQGYNTALYNASNGAAAGGLAVKIAGTASSNTILDLSTGAAAATAGTSVMSVLGNGNVGIGTNAPSSRLYVAYGSGSGPAVTIESGSGQYPTTLSILASTHATSRRSGMRLDDWYLLQDINGTGTKDFGIWQAATSLHRLFIKTDGNVGIGTTSPAYTLDVAGQGNFTGSGGSSAGVISTRAANPGMAWNMSGNATDEKWWDLLAASGRFMGRAVDDANSSATTWLQVNRGTATTINSVTFPSGDVGIGTTGPGAKLHVEGSIRMVDGNQGAGKIMISDANGTGSWTSVSSAIGNNEWSTTGNTGTTDLTNYIGTTDNIPFTVKTNGQISGRVDPLLSNAFWGYWAGKSYTTGTQNAAVGTNALKDNTIGAKNTVMGTSALESSVAGSNAVAIGYAAQQYANNTGSAYVNYSVAVGSEALMGSTTASANTGNYNTAVGFQTLMDNTTANSGVALGAYALSNNTTGNYNTAAGVNALITNTTGGVNSGFGLNSLHNNTTGNSSTAVGYNAGYSNTTGSRNTFLGDSADVTSVNLVNATAIGWNSRVGASNSLVLGAVNGVNGVTSVTNVGIGTTTPGSLLDAQSSAAATISVLSSAAAAYLATSAPSANEAAVKFNTAGSQRWMIGKSTGSESGSDAGSDFFINRYSDAGSYLSQPVVIKRSTGYVGIGASPSYPLDINTTLSTSYSAYGYVTNNSSTPTGYNSGSSGSVAVSVRAVGRVLASEFGAVSDARVKKVISRTNNADDLKALSEIQITDYRYVDTVGKGTGIHKKVIAQELEQVYPQAVSNVTDVIPNIYKIAEIKAGRVTVTNDLKTGDKVKLIFAEREELVDVVSADANGFNVNVKDEGKVFVFGKQVSDFHVVDYESLTTLNISATQELLKQINQLKAENKELKSGKADASDVNELKLQVEELKQLMLKSGVRTDK